MINPRSGARDVRQMEFSLIEPLLSDALKQGSNEPEQVERVVAAQGMARAAELLSGQYTLAITNVPYLGRGQQSELAKRFADENYKESKADLATMFVERMMYWLAGKGTAANKPPANKPPANKPKRR